MRTLGTLKNFLLFGLNKADKNDKKILDLTAGILQMTILF